MEKKKSLLGNSLNIPTINRKLIRETSEYLNNTSPDVPNFKRLRSSQAEETINSCPKLEGEKINLRGDMMDVGQGQQFQQKGLVANPQGDDPLYQSMLELRKVVTWTNTETKVIGHNDIKEAIQGAFLMLNTTQKVKGTLVPKNVLIAGVGGIGKTELQKSLAVSIAKLLKRPIYTFNVKAWDFLRKYYGETERAIKYFFDVVEMSQPALVLFDEVDAIMRKRGDDDSDASRRFKCTLLAEMRGDRDLCNVVICCVTNKPQDLDDNFITRFAYKFLAMPPDDDERKQLFEMYLKLWEESVEVDWDSVNWKVLEQRTKGFTGSDISTAVGMAALDLLRVKFNGKLYRVSELEHIRKELDAESTPCESIVLPINMSGLCTTIARVGPSCKAMDMKDLKDWARKWIRNPTLRKPATETVDKKPCTCYCCNCKPF